MILDVVKLAIGAGTHIMKNRQQRKMLESDAAMLHEPSCSSSNKENEIKIVSFSIKHGRDISFSPCVLSLASQLEDAQQ